MSLKGIVKASTVDASSIAMMHDFIWRSNRPLTNGRQQTNGKVFPCGPLEGLKLSAVLSHEFCLDRHLRP